MELELLKRDIARQPAAFRAHAARLSEIPARVAALCGDGPVQLTGIATSLWGLEGAVYLLAQQGVTRAALLNTCDLIDYWAPPGAAGCPLFVASRSGESAEILRLLDAVRPGRPLIALTECPESPLARAAKLPLVFEAGEEAFPNTLSFTLTQLYALAAACGLGLYTAMPPEALAGEAAQAAEALLAGPGEAEEIGALAARAAGVLVEGQGHLSGVVSQYALDFHETRTLAVPVTGGILRHGVIELCGRGDLLTLLLVPDDAAAPRKLALAEELAAGGRPAALLTDCAASPGGVPTLRLPRCPRELQSVVFTLGMQLVYLHYARAKGLGRLKPALVEKVTRKE